MKFKIFFPFLALMLFTACSEQENSTLPFQPKSPFGSFHENQLNASKEDEHTNIPERKYGIKSGIVHFETWFRFEGELWEETSIVYFDDYGKKERRERYLLDGSLWETQFNDGTHLYSVYPEGKSAYKHKSTYPGTEPRVSWADLPAAHKTNGWAEKGPYESVAGKTCEVYFVPIDGGKQKFAGWENICFLNEMIGSGYGDTSHRAVSFQEVSVDPKLFVLPVDYTVLPN